jgi:hypothetical protein
MEPIVREALWELNQESGNVEFVFTNPDTGTRMLRKHFQQRAEKRTLPTSRFMIYVTRSVLA